MRLEALTVRKYRDRNGQEKSAWTKIGVAFPHANGAGFSLHLELIPAPTPDKKTGDLKYEIVLREPLPRESRVAQEVASLDDEIPF